MEDNYLIFKLAHIISAAIICGYGVVSVFLFLRVRNRDKVKLINEIARLLKKFGICIIIPIMFMQVFTGGVLLKITGYDLKETWIGASLISYIILLWLIVLSVKIKARIRKIQEKELIETFIKRSIRIDSIILILLFLIYNLMIYRYQ
jgi:uncharacterized membrane protein